MGAVIERNRLIEGVVEEQSCQQPPINPDLVLSLFFFRRIETKTKNLSYNFPLGVTQVVNSSKPIDLSFMGLRAVHLNPCEQTRELGLPAR
ncbi:MAG: hypothetical protein Q8S00_25940 [Deltaproteobacteria bacterium]|nr:hypothetical protein [Deltaproteobacteria bacterium]MDZ4347707.1 hypothetical protein [Candidatus Binatia bacterium]